MVQGYEMVAGQPAWQKMRNMHLHPKDAVLPDGKIMTGNVFNRNIIYYRDPEAKLFSFRNLPLDHYESDNNVVWHFGLPLVTGQQKAGKNLSENLAPNWNFARGGLGQLPEDWRWQVRPTPTTKAGLVLADGNRVLRIEGGQSKDAKGRDQFGNIVSKDVPVRFGASYRLVARLRATKPDAKVGLMLQSYVANAYFWASPQNETRVGTEWKNCEVVFAVPSKGEKGFHEKMKTFCVRLDLREPDGALEVEAVALREVELLDQWKSWQALGFDRHSLVADPKCVDPAKDDYRLQSDSPALRLGFQPIPVEKIGPYKDELRATWPIVEAEGAREKPLK
jgi:hypothetical protein